MRPSWLGASIVFLVLIGSWQVAVAQSSSARLHGGIVSGNYESTGEFLLDTSRGLMGIHLEVESLWSGSASSLIFLGQANFESSTNVLAEMALAIGISRYLRLPRRPELVQGNAFVLSQDPNWNVRIAGYGGLGRQLLTFSESSEVNTDTLLGGFNCLFLIPWSADWSIVAGPDWHYSFGIGRFDSQGQTLLFRLGMELAI
jgi:hypothetical protein